MNIKKAIEICEERGWEVSKGKYFLYADEDRVIFNSDKELIDYVTDLDNVGDRD